MYMYIIEMKKIEFFNNQMFKMILVFCKYYLFCFGRLCGGYII